MYIEIYCGYVQAIKPTLLIFTDLMYEKMNFYRASVPCHVGLGAL